MINLDNEFDLALVALFRGMITHAAHRFWDEISDEEKISNRNPKGSKEVYLNQDIFVMG
jgi:hypothetical protein